MKAAKVIGMLAVALILGVLLFGDRGKKQIIVSSDQVPPRWGAEIAPRAELSHTYQEKISPHVDDRNAQLSAEEKAEMLRLFLEMMMMLREIRKCHQLLEQNNGQFEEISRQQRLLSIQMQVLQAYGRQNREAAHRQADEVQQILQRMSELEQKIDEIERRELNRPSLWAPGPKSNF
ncbi:MAG TPA: hypothetical protein VHA78_04520 [Candidatus Peribacteraceae bacterium]|nr:hypothetical protein [Candidatus Peribacteraceae bacterium]